MLSEQYLGKKGITIPFNMWVTHIYNPTTGFYEKRPNMEYPVQRYVGPDITDDASSVSTTIIEPPRPPQLIRESGITSDSSYSNSTF